MAFHAILRAALAVALLAFAALPAALRAEGGFVSGTGDVPLMAGLEEAASGLVFETPGGRVVDVTAEGAVAADRVRRFYDDTLPQLGWLADGGGRFSREGESLIIEVTPLAGGGASVRFRLGPRAD